MGKTHKLKVKGQPFNEKKREHGVRPEDNPIKKAHEGSALRKAATGTPWLQASHTARLPTTGCSRTQTSTSSKRNREEQAVPDRGEGAKKKANKTKQTWRRPTPPTTVQARSSTPRSCRSSRPEQKMRSRGRSKLKLSLKVMDYINHSHEQWRRRHSHTRSPGHQQWRKIIIKGSF